MAVGTPWPSEMIPPRAGLSHSENHLMILVEVDSSPGVFAPDAPRLLRNAALHLSGLAVRTADFTGHALGLCNGPSNAEGGTSINGATDGMTEMGGIMA